MPEIAQSPRAWRVVLEHIERDLLDGRIGPGDRLPSERDLASGLGVGRSSVREALRVLEVLGLIRTAWQRHGVGPRCYERTMTPAQTDIEHCEGTVIRHIGQRPECTEPDCTTPEIAHSFVVDCFAVGCGCGEAVADQPIGPAVSGLSSAG